MNILAAVCIITSTLVGAQNQSDSGGRTLQQPPVILEFSVDNGTGSLGEPIILNYRVLNRTNGSVTIDWLKENIAYGNTEPPKIPPWLSVSITSPQGEPARLDYPNRPRYYGDHLSAIPQATSANDTVREGAVVLSQWFHPRSPGVYKVRVTPNLRYTCGDGSSGIIKEARTLDVVVGITSQRKLLARAEALRSQILAEPSGDKRYALVIALVHMPDTVYGVLRALMQDRRFHDREFAIWQLRWKGTKQSVTLAQEFSPQYHPGVRVEVENKGNGTP